MSTELVANTHGQVVAGAGAAAAGESLLGTITLPAGGDWLIHGVYCQGVAATQAAAEHYGGYFRLDVASGDLTPNPAPSRFPWDGGQSSLGATINRGQSKLNIFPVEYTAAGKAVINIVVANYTAVAVAPQFVAGIIYSKTMPETLPFNFVDYVNADIHVAPLTSIGNITISEKATKIIGVCGTLNQTGVTVTAEELLGYFQLSSNDVKLPPSQFPFNSAWGAGLGALIQGGSEGNISFIPVDIPIPGGAIINAAADLNTAVTNATNANVYIAYI